MRLRLKYEFPTLQLNAADISDALPFGHFWYGKPDAVSSPTI
jgi:hypothetical protein